MADSESNPRFEIRHVLFLDIVGYSKLLIEEQKERLSQLTQIVLATASVREATDEQLVRLPTGDGMALVFRHNTEEPARCALEIAEALRKHPELSVRMGIHSGPVSEVTDVSGRTNIAGPGINMAQRVMDCGDGGHILLSRHVAEDLEHYGHWRPLLHDLGECEVKHGVRMHVFNLYQDGANQSGNSELPQKFKAQATQTTITRPLPRAVVATAIITLGLLGYWAINKTRSAVSHSPIPNKSIAVLPFANLSRDPDNEYFAVGIQDEILTRLAKLGQLKVISRTSTRQYQSKPDSVRDIGRELGVATILEGTVQRVANNTRVNVQLIRAATDEHLWADTFDRKVTDVFSVESEVAKAIAEQLQAKLTGEEEKAVADKPTNNPQAYDAYLRGVATENQSKSQRNTTKAAADYEQAVRLDPAFALAWARLAIARSFLHATLVEPEVNTPAAVKQASDQAMSLQPGLGEAWAAEASYRYRVLRDYRSAVEAYRRALQKLPNSSLVLEELAYVERRLGQWDQALTHYRAALNLDPRNLKLWGGINGALLIPLRRFEEAQAALDRRLALGESPEIVRAEKASAYVDEGCLEQASEQLAQVPPDSRDASVLLARAIVSSRHRRFEEAVNYMKGYLHEITAADQTLDASNVSALIDLGYYQEWAGQVDNARDTFTRAVQIIKPTPDTVVPVAADQLPCYLAWAYAGLGRKEEALEQALRAVEAYKDDASDVAEAQLALAAVEARFGDRDAAIAGLAHLLEVPSTVTVGVLRFDPTWDPLRQDPRFQKLANGESSVK